VIGTPTPSEQIFSTTGLIINAKRTMLSSENAGKIRVIHDNYNLLEKVYVRFYCCIHLCYNELFVYKYLLMLIRV
jgi:hypothetical protein